MSLDGKTTGKANGESGPQDPPPGPLGRISSMAQPLRAFLFAPPRHGARARRRPLNLVYGLEDKVPLGPLMALSAQHAMLALTLLIYPMVAAAEAQLAPAQANAMLSACAMCIGLATMIQCARSRFGSGYLAVHVPSAGALPLAIQALALGGVGLMAATTLAGRPQPAVRRPAGAAVTGGAAARGLRRGGDDAGGFLAAPALRRALGLSELNSQWRARR